MAEAKPRAQKALTWRSILALLFAVVVVEPAVIYNYLVNGILGLAITSWLVILLWAELAAFFGSPLTAGEIFAILTFEWAGVWVSAWHFVNLLKNLYFANAEITRVLGILEIPKFFAPTGAEALDVMMKRTFLHHAWIQPFLVSIVGMWLLPLAANLALGFFAYNYYGVVQRLDFPAAISQAETINTIAKRDPNYLRVLALAIVVGALYNFMTTGITGLLGGAVQLIPRMPIDITKSTEPLLPGVPMVFYTDLVPYLAGMILPLDVALAQFIGSFAIYCVGNYIVTVKGLWPAEAQYHPGLWTGFELVDFASRYFWTSVAIGLGLAAAVVPLIVHFKDVSKAFKISGAGARGYAQYRWLFIYFGVALLSVALVKILVPKFPLWILLAFTVGWSFVVTMLQTYSAGVTLGFEMPYLREVVIYYSGYRGIDAWFAPITLFTGGSAIATQLKVAELVGVGTREYIKAYLLAAFLGLLGSFAFTQLFWHAAPIPSWAYPYTVTGWPKEASDFWSFQKWLWRGYLFRKQGIVGGLLGGAAIYLICDLLLHRPHLFIAAVTGVMGGLTILPPGYYLAMLIGSWLSERVFRKIVGEPWERWRYLIFMGFTFGDGLMGTLTGLIGLAGRAMWLVPY